MERDKQLFMLANSMNFNVQILDTRPPFCRQTCNHSHNRTQHRHEDIPYLDLKPIVRQIQTWPELEQLIIKSAPKRVPARINIQLNHTLHKKTYNGCTSGNINLQEVLPVMPWEISSKESCSFINTSETCLSASQLVPSATVE